jgi:hypothetical protein
VVTVAAVSIKIVRVCIVCEDKMTLVTHEGNDKTVERVD